MNQDKIWEQVGEPTKTLSADQALIYLNSADSVAVAARDLVAGEQLGDVVARDEIPKGHKIAIKDIAVGEVVRKYAQSIGFASQTIGVGEHIHNHNLIFGTTDLDYKVGSDAKTVEFIDEDQRTTFMGYRRNDGKVGTRNYIGVISSVNCSATACRRIAAYFTPDRLASYANIDGVAAFIHGTGCGMASEGEGMSNLQRVMHGYAVHPNVAGALVLGLGCEANQIETLLEAEGMERSPLLKTMNIQSAGGLNQAVKMGIKAIEAMLPQANEWRRESCPASELMLALQCGGSDAWSGITANPALGHAADLLVAQGGTAVIAETPEVYGAEHLLTCRASSADVAADLLDRIKWWEGYTERNGGSMDNNPSPGNKLGGLTTILEKSLGAVAKGGTTNLNGFYGYGVPVTARGFVMMDSPGYDPASVTGQIASGCNLVAFTTGRGSAFGSKPAPTLKICTNSDTFRRMPDDMDIDAGVIVTDGVPIAQVGEAIFKHLLALASGEESKSEAQGLGDHEFVPWQIGATM